MDNITVTDVDWRSITDNELTWLLQGLTSFVRRLDLGSNSLTQIPALTQYREMETLQKLYLYNNQIQTLVWDNVPTQVWYLSLGNNRLQSLPVLGQAQRCLQVRELRLNGNNIQLLQPENLPVTVEVLHISGNRLTEVGDISQLPLKVLSLHNNNLRELNGQYLPPSLEELWLHGNPLSGTVDLTHLVNLTELGVSPSDCQQYRQMLPSVNVYKTYYSRCL